MMRKLSLCLIILFIAVLPVSSYKALDKRELILTGYKGRYHNFIIKPTIGNLNDGAGMPFDLTRADVAYQAVGDDDTTGDATTHGREIATWSLHSNYTPVTIKIKAEPLELVTENTDPTKKTEGLNYILFFPYTYNGVDSSGNPTRSVTGFMRVESINREYDSTKDEEWPPDNTNPISQLNSSGAATGIGISTGTYPVRFMLDDSVDINSYAPGTYNANVTITVEGREL